jgi:peptidoglycan/xylan/chitin deacetylase (PgdA/CDA1 family)
MLKPAKLAFLGAMRGSRIMRAVARSDWRRQRLLILCYHGVSLEDEHLWNPTLYVDPATLDARLALMRREGYSVLAFDAAISALNDGTLPDRAVTITFDDGHYDFLPVAYPILRKHGCPATVYLTTYHVDRNVPIFNLFCSYVLWKARTRAIDLRAIMGGPRIDLARPADRHQVLSRLDAHVRRAAMSTAEKNVLARGVAEAVGVDFDDLCERRVLHLLNGTEVGELARSGIDFQLHTHCHRSPRNEQEYRHQVLRNRERIETLVGRTPEHFCYPSGVTAPEFIGWLAAEGVLTGVTCEPGLAHRQSNRYLLPRLLDHCGLSTLEFEGWLSGVSTIAPRRAY